MMLKSSLTTALIAAAFLPLCSLSDSFLGGLLGTATATAYSSFDTPHFSSARTCVLCHNHLQDEDGNDVSLEQDWGATMMAHSALDPLWQAKVASEIARAPHLADLISDKCSRCHMPMANVELTASGDPISILDGPASGDGLLDPRHPLHAAATEGVSCTLCHQIEDDGNLGLLEGFSGHFTIADHDAPSDRTIYGPVPDPRINPMRNRSGFTPTYAQHVSDSALCGTCHNLKTPFVDAHGDLASGGPASEFAEQMPYTEWEVSAFGPGGETPRSCQSCHMPETDGVKLSNRPPWLTPVDGFSRHRFLGANTTLLDILNRNRNALGVTSKGLGQAIKDARGLLKEAAELKLVSARVQSSEGSNVLRIKLSVVNQSGHKLPTSYPSRRVWLHLKVTDDSGRIVFESGRMRSDGRIVGANGDASPTAYEPHHREITKPGQVQIYEPIMADTNGKVTHTLLRAGSYLKDNRLTPAGFEKKGAPGDVRVAGRAAEDADFDAGKDRISYRIPLSGSSTRYRVQVRLNYQTLSWPFLRDLFRDDHLSEVARFKRLYENQGILSENIAKLSFNVNR